MFAKKPKKAGPSHRVFAVVKQNNKSYWREIGATWPHADGKGFGLRLDYLPLNGADLAIREPMAETPPEGVADGREGGAQ